MHLKFTNITDKSQYKLYYVALVIVASLIPLMHYPRLYGVDSFQVIWMARAIRNGALFSENTWLIHPASYFGYYPFSHRAIGIPVFLAFLLSFLEIISFGVLGLPETVLVFNLIIIVITCKCSRDLANTLFKEEWSRFVFTTSVLFSQFFLNANTMQVSTRIIITIIMIILLNLQMKILTNSKEISNIKTMLYMFLLLFVGALAHRLWLGTVITIVFMLFTLLIRRYKKLQHFSLLLILPVIIFFYFYGIEFFGLDSRYGLGVDPNLLEISVFFLFTYAFALGVISLFLPIGVIIPLYRMLFNNSVSITSSSKESKPLKLTAPSNQFDNKTYYLLLLTIPFSFTVATTKYSLVLFLPLLLIFSVQGLIYIKKFVSKFSNSVEWLFPILFCISVIIYPFLRLENYSGINYSNVFLFLLIAFLLLLGTFLIKNFKRIHFSKFTINTRKLKRSFWMIGLLVPILTFSVISIESTRVDYTNSPYPWENRYLTEEEFEIIEFFQREDLNGFIFVADRYISERIGSVGFFPTFFTRSYIGTSLYYGLISSKEVHQNTNFYLPEFGVFIFFKYEKLDPIRSLIYNIKRLNVSKKNDFEVLLSYNIQYIITINQTFISSSVNNWNLIESLQQSEFVFSNQPVFSTKHFLIWKIY